jgi:DNA-binding MarR family transcriptional regulator
MTTRWLADHPTFALLEAASRAKDILLPALSSLGVDLRELRLLVVIEREGPLSQRELSDIAGIEKSSMVTVVDSLETKHLARRTREPSDRRINRIVLTPAGFALLRRAPQNLVGSEKRLLDALDFTERKALQGLLGRINRRTMTG